MERWKKNGFFRFINKNFETRNSYWKVAFAHFLFCGIILILQGKNLFIVYQFFDEDCKLICVHLFNRNIVKEEKKTKKHRCDLLLAWFSCLGWFADDWNSTVYWGYIFKHSYFPIWGEMKEVAMIYFKGGVKRKFPSVARAKFWKNGIFKLWKLHLSEVWFRMVSDERVGEIWKNWYFQALENWIIKFHEKSDEFSVIWVLNPV